MATNVAWARWLVDGDSIWRHYDVIDYTIFDNSVLWKIVDFMTWVVYLIGNENSKKAQKMFILCIRKLCKIFLAFR